MEEDDDEGEDEEVLPEDVQGGAHSDGSGGLGGGIAGVLS